MDARGNDGASLGLSDGGLTTLRFRFAGQRRPFCPHFFHQIAPLAHLQHFGSSEYPCEELLFEDDRGLHWIAVTASVSATVRSSAAISAEFLLSSRFLGGMRGRDGWHAAFLGSAISTAAL
jgi:hypothetical protein